MHPINAKVLGLAMLTSVCLAGPAHAKDRHLTPEEAQIAEAFDHAVRGDRSLAGFSSLPWAPDAHISGFDILRHLAPCKFSAPKVRNDTLLLSWEGSADADAELPCGYLGYYAQIRLKNGRIRRVTLVEPQIILTSGSSPKS